MVVHQLGGWSGDGEPGIVPEAQSSSNSLMATQPPAKLWDHAGDPGGHGPEPHCESSAFGSASNTKSINTLGNKNFIRSFLKICSTFNITGHYQGKNTEDSLEKDTVNREKKLRSKSEMG